MGDGLMNLVVIILLLLAAVPGAYYMGLFFSRGYHRGKHEWLGRMYALHCKPERDAEGEG